MCWHQFGNEEGNAKEFPFKNSDEEDLWQLYK